MGKGLNSGSTYGVRIYLWKKPFKTYSFLHPAKMDGLQRHESKLGKGVVGALTFQGSLMIGILTKWRFSCGNCNRSQLKGKRRTN